MPKKVDTSVEATVESKRRQPLSQQLLNWLGIRPEDTQIPGDATKVSTEPVDDMLPTVKDQLPGMLNDRYQLTRTLGRGACGIVYQAKDLRIGRVIAVKLLYKNTSTTSLTYRRFLQEARVAGQVENPHIVTIYDVDDSVPCILMEFLGGGNLYQRMQAEAPFSEETSLRLIRGILMGLASAHRIGVVHRDIKPQNILFDQYGNPRISDFGIAHLPVEQGGINEEDGWSSVAGTPNYMAPEQMVPGGEIDGRADLYAVGIMAYEMLTGERPYRAGNATSLYELREVVDNSPMPTAADFPPQISAKTRSLVLRMMQRAPRKRFDTADGVVNAIDDSLSELVTVGEAQNISRERVSVRLEMFEDILRMFLVDGVVSPPERRELIKRAQRLGISERVSRKSEEKVRKEMDLPTMKNLQTYESRAADLLGDRDFSEADRLELCALGDKLGINIDQQRRIDDAVMVRFRMKQGDSDDAGLI